MVKRLFIFLILIFSLHEQAYTKDRLVAVIIAANVTKFKIAYEAFQKTIRDANMADSVQIVLSTTNPDPSSWANAVKRAEGQGVDFIVVFGASLLHSAIKEHVELPIIFADVYEPEIIKNIGRDVGGVYNNIPAATMLKHLLAIENVKTLHILYCPYEKESEQQANKVKQIAEFEKINAVKHALTSASRIPSINLSKNEAIFVTSSVLLETDMARIVSFANSHEVPVVGLSEIVTSSGGLLALAPDAKEQGVAVGNFVLKYIKTNKMPQNVQLTKNNFIVNMEAGKRLKLTIPFSVLNTATKVLK